MPKTKRTLLSALADRIGGGHGRRMRAALSRIAPFDDLLDRPMDDAAYDSELKRLETDLPKAFATMKPREWERPGSWGLAN